MKRFLYIAFYFPPVGSSSTARNIGFAKNLKSLGIEPYVLTVKKKTFEKLPTARTDSSFDSDINNLEITRTSSLIPAWFLKLLYKFKLSRLIRILFPIEIHVFWILPAVLKGIKIIKEKEIDLIFSSALPNSSNFIGFILHKLTGKPWIADFQDPMAYRLGDRWFTAITGKLIQFLEKCICKSASGIITHSEGSKEILLEKYRFLNKEKIIAITNAFDTALNAPRKKSDKSKFRIVHSGEFYSHYSKNEDAPFSVKKLFARTLGFFEYRNYRANFKTHSAVPLLTALGEIIKENPDIRERLEIVLNGYLHPNDSRLITMLNLGGYVTATGLTNYKKSIEIINSADLLYFPMSIDLSRKRNYWIPSKIFPYIASLRPILAPIQDGNARDILKKSGLGLICEAGDTDTLKALIINTINQSNSQDSTSIGNINFIETFSRIEKARKLKDFMLKTYNLQSKIKSR